MKALSRRAVAAAAAAILCVRFAVSQVPSAHDRSKRATPKKDCAETCQKAVENLEQQISSLEGELTEVREELLLLRNAGPSREPTAEAEPSEPGDESWFPKNCDPPFVVDNSGIKRFRSECLDQPRCDPPFVVDDNGIKRFLPECLDQMRVAGMSSDDCSPPYSLHDDGVKRIKLQCL
jgi:hypothetical protein